MANVPPPASPQVSPDGKFYWDGERWVPMQPSLPFTAQPSASPVAPTPRSSGRRNGCIGVALLVTLLAAIAFCGSRPSTPTTATNPGGSQSPSPDQLAGPVVNHTVFTFSGTGYETTQPFNIPSSEWTLSWTIAGDPTYADVTFYIYASDGSTVDSVGGKPGRDAATIHQGNDAFFITVLVANAKYKATVTAAYRGPTPAFAVPRQAKLAVYKGSGDKSTPTFHITGSIWLIAVQAGSTNQYTSVTAYVYNAADKSDVSEASVEGAQGGSKTIDYIYVGPGAYYIKVLSANTSWTVTVEQSSS